MTHIHQPILTRLGLYHLVCVSRANTSPAKVKQGEPRICTATEAGAQSASTLYPRKKEKKKSW